MEALTGASRLTKEGVLVAAPDGYRRSWADARGTTPASKDGIDDVRFLSQLIDELIAKHHADPTHVYVMGMSNGGMMALTLACQLSDRLAGVVSVTGLMPPSLEKECQPSKPISVALIHGTKDPVVPYSGGPVTSDGGPVLSADASAQFWARVNGCEPPTRTAVPDADPADGTTTALHAWNRCRNGVEVRLYSVEGGGHTWPEGKQYLGKWIIGQTSRDFSATDEAWRFLQSHRRQ
jgi:polyhydroxybutyrate depolymerase